MWSKVSEYRELLNFVRSGTIAMTYNTVSVVTFDEETKRYKGWGMTIIKSFTEADLQRKIVKDKDNFSALLYHLSGKASKLALVAIESSTPVYEKGPLIAEG